MNFALAEHTRTNSESERQRLLKKLKALDQRVPVVDRKFERALRGQSTDTEQITKEKEAA